jgi:hypothetical protein
MSERTRPEIEQLVTDMCDRYDEATRKRVWFRMQTVVEYHNLSANA